MAVRLGRRGLRGGADLAARVYPGAHHLSGAVTSLVFAPVWIATVAVVVLGHRVRRVEDRAVE